MNDYGVTLGKANALVVAVIIIVVTLMILLGGKLEKRPQTIQEESYNNVSKIDSEN